MSITNAQIREPQLGKPSLAAAADPTSLPPLRPISAPPSADEQREILNSIRPPREWTDEGHLWRQQVSSIPATRLDVLNLQEQLDARLQQRQAREMGICPVRRELYTQCFDEVIRQVTINCAERGLLLLRIRDEIRMTISAYQILHESSVAFGIRKALMAEQGRADLEAAVAKLCSEKSELEKQVVELRSRADQIERRSNEQKLAEEKKHTEQIQNLMKTNQQLKAQLEGIVAPQK
ncbi:33 kDa inner dynein arm light chain, axonemal isoform X2 [Zootermopsis nevadensis]|uniref:33 kDa inner dynein arm light chain, axonemal isoform X2 n=1 Tax=Zootermopsis nevadensis TaxID=136037 RepID=UPI000B8E7E88|nr:33 kDa inner dynein arm light chain, axonemal isoform X2 [Zootermopsis nevadensis]